MWEGDSREPDFVHTQVHALSPKKKRMEKMHLKGFPKWDKQKIRRRTRRRDEIALWGEKMNNFESFFLHPREIEIMKKLMKLIKAGSRRADDWRGAIKDNQNINRIYGEWLWLHFHLLWNLSLWSSRPKPFIVGEKNRFNFLRLLPDPLWNLKFKPIGMFEFDAIVSIWDVSDHLNVKQWWFFWQQYSIPRRKHSIFKGRISHRIPKSAKTIWSKPSQTPGSRHTIFFGEWENCCSMRPLFVAWFGSTNN